MDEKPKKKKLTEKQLAALDKGRKKRHRKLRKMKRNKEK